MMLAQVTIAPYPPSTIHRSSESQSLRRCSGEFGEDRLSARSLALEHESAQSGSRIRVYRRTMLSSDTSAEVLDRDLWVRVSAAIRAANIAIGRHLAGGPSAAVPTMAKFDDSGWPNIHFPVTPGKETLDYSRLFGITAGEITSFSYDDIAELADVIAYVISRSDPVEKLELLRDLVARQCRAEQIRRMRRH